MSLFSGVRRKFKRKPCNGFILRDPHGIPLASATGLATEGVLFEVESEGTACDVVRIPTGERYQFDSPYPAKAGDHIFFTVDIEV